MASTIMTATSQFLGGSATVSSARQIPATTCRAGVVSVRAATTASSVEMAAKEEIIKVNTRRGLMFASLAMAAAGSVAKAAMADEPKPGSPEAKKKYAPICVTMPTARICRN